MQQTSTSPRLIRRARAYARMKERGLSRASRGGFCRIAAEADSAADARPEVFWHGREKLRRLGRTRAPSQSVLSAALHLPSRRPYSYRRPAHPLLPSSCLHCPSSRISRRVARHDCPQRESLSPSLLASAVPVGAHHRPSPSTSPPVRPLSPPASATAAAARGPATGASLDSYMSQETSSTLPGSTAKPADCIPPRLSHPSRPIGLPKLPSQMFEC